MQMQNLHIRFPSSCSTLFRENEGKDFFVSLRIQRGFVGPQQKPADVVWSVQGR